MLWGGGPLERARERTIALLYQKYRPCRSCEGMIFTCMELLEIWGCAGSRVVLTLLGKLTSLTLKTRLSCAPLCSLTGKSHSPGCCAQAVLSTCNACYAHAMHMICTCYAHAMHVLCMLQPLYAWHAPLTHDMCEGCEEQGMQGA
jgi:hypothetical protein